MVLLFSLSETYQGFSYEIDSKYGGRETSRCSSALSRSKDGASGLTNRYIYHPQIKLLLSMVKTKNLKGKVFVSRGRQVTT